MQAAAVARARVLLSAGIRIVPFDTEDASLVAWWREMHLAWLLPGGLCEESDRAQLSNPRVRAWRVVLMALTLAILTHTGSLDLTARVH